MTQEELNEQTIELLRKQLQAGDNLVIAVVVNTRHKTVKQVVGYGVSLSLVEEAFKMSLYNLRKEVAERNSRM